LKSREEGHERRDSTGNEPAFCRDNFSAKRISLHRRTPNALGGMPMSSPVVYVIDDDDACRKALGLLLPAMGFAAQTFRSAREFLEQLPRSSMGCVVADMRMPEMSGVELVGRLREVDPHLPVILVSGALGAASADKAAEFGAVAVLSKPFDVGQLKESLDIAFELLKDRRSAPARHVDA
jgi:FixJ family two-component response regulator